MRTRMKGASEEIQENVTKTVFSFCSERVRGQQHV